MGGSPPRDRFAVTAKKPKKINDCENLNIITQLKSPVDAVVFKIKEGEFLDITVLPPDQCVALYRGEIAGKIVCLELKELMDCLKLGNLYHARVRNVAGLRCSLTITRK